MNKTKTTILILSTSYPSWTEKNKEFMRGKFVHDMAKYLVLAGHRVQVIAPKSVGGSVREVVDGVEIKRFSFFPSVYGLVTGGAGIPENIGKFRFLVQVPFLFFFMFVHSLIMILKEDVSIVNVHWAFPTGFVGVFLKFLTGRPLITTAYGAELFPFLAGKMKGLVPLVRWSLLRADEVVGISQETCKAVRAISGRERVTLIPDGIDMGYYSVGEKSEKIRAKYGFSPEHQVVFFTGRMVERKGHIVLLRAVELALKRLSGIRLLLGGRGPMEVELKEFVRKNRLEEKVFLPGFIDEKDIVPLLQSVDLFVLPSCIDKNGDTEGSATAAFEAMACGCPALVSFVGGNEGALQEGEGAFYFKTNDADALAEKMIEILGDVVCLEKLRSSARAFIISRYSWEASIEKYERLFP